MTYRILLVPPITKAAEVVVDMRRDRQADIVETGDLYLVNAAIVDPRKALIIWVAAGDTVVVAMATEAEAAEDTTATLKHSTLITTRETLTEN